MKIKAFQGGFDKNFSYLIWCKKTKYAAIIDPAVSINPILETINKHSLLLDKKVKLFIQVNLGMEEQKSGILLSDLVNFYNYCTKELSLNIIGLMCLPPFDSDSSKYFKTLKKSSEKLNLVDLSMGMSSDYEQAMLNGSTYLRLGTAIFGQRKII